MTRTFLDALVAEHERILAVLGAMNDFAAWHAHDDPEARAALRQFVRFLREYLDGWHHAKEEALLFEAMVHAGLPRESGPVGCMLHEHELGRGQVAELAALALGDAPFTAAELARLDELSRRHGSLLTAHVAKENQMLYPMAARLLPGEIQEAIEGAAVALLERRGAGVVHELEAQGELLVARYGAARVAMER